jgi:hypothetical protein
MKCIVCGQDKSPEIHFDVPVICRECARLQSVQIAKQTSPDEKADVITSIDQRMIGT